MNRMNMKKDKITRYKAVIFDLDGTLYYQKPFRMRMACFLAGYVVRHPSSLKDMLIIKKYRKVREDWEKYDKIFYTSNEERLDERQYMYVAAEMGVSHKRVKETIVFFMHETPLKLLAAYRDEVLSNIITVLRKQGITVIIYSDYPVEDKLKALKIQADACYTSADIGCMKPDPKGIQVILKEQKLSNTEALMVGDRYEKDGLAAEANDVDYIIVSTKKKEREALRDLLG